MNDEKEPIIVKPGISLNIMGEEYFPNNPFREKFDSEFWQLVSELYQDGEGEISWSAALTKIRVQKIVEQYEENGKNVFIGLLEDVYDGFYKKVTDSHQADELLPSFIQQLTELVTVILNKDFELSKASGKKSTYSKLLKCSDGSKMTALHMVAERNLTNIAQHLLNLYPGQCYIKSSGTIGKKIALELSLEKQMDSVSSLLIKSMLNERVRQLFEFDEANGRCKFSFSQMTRNVKMKETVMAVLDCLINADYPYVPAPPGEDEEQAWSKIPDVPMRYHVYYRLLDGDDMGRPAKIKSLQTGQHVNNEAFDHLSPSGLQSIANSPLNNDIIGHPAVRLLVQRKWEMFGAKRIRLYAAFYFFFLVFMTLAFFLPTTSNDRTIYETKLEYFRGTCEFIMYFISLVYLITEVDQMFKEKMMYWLDVWNYLDLLGLFLILSLLIIKWTAVHMIKEDPSMLEWSVASVAYLINFLRLVKFFPAFKTIGIYSKTFADIFYKDISKFFFLYSVIMAAFTGSAILAISATSDGLKKAGLTKWEILLQEIRALTEGAGFAESYTGVFRTVVIILLMVNMFVIIVMLTNILIGQLSYRYEKALDNAHVQYDLDKTKIVTKIENSRFRKTNQRIQHYVDGAFITEPALVDSLLDDWKTLKGMKTEDDHEHVKKLIHKLSTKKKMC